MVIPEIGPGVVGIAAKSRSELSIQVCHRIRQCHSALNHGCKRINVAHNWPEHLRGQNLRVLDHIGGLLESLSELRALAEVLIRELPIIEKLSEFCSKRKNTGSCRSRLLQDQRRRQCHSDQTCSHVCLP